MIDGILDFAYLSVWLVQSLYFIGLIPQIITNYRLKSAKGFSDLMFCAYFCGYLFNLFYIYFLNLPLSYKIMVPLATFATLILVFQRFYYSSSSFDKDFSRLFGIFLLIACGLIFLVFKFTDNEGRVFGWMAMAMWTFYPIPQIIKIFTRKSVKGFSIGFIITMGLGISIEFISALILRLPLSTVFSCLRGIFVYFIFGIQFLLYRVNAKL